MSHCKIDYIFAVALSITGLGTGFSVVSCSSSSPVPDVSDASTPDAAALDAATPDAGAPDANACACPGTELLSREHMIDTWGFVREGVIGEYIGCEQLTDLILAGGCSFLDPGVSDAMAETFLAADRNAWICTRQTVNQAFNVATRCLRPMERLSEVPEGCTCPDVETPANRVFYKEQAAVVPAAGVGGVDVTCPAGSTLVGGGCQGGHSGFSGDALVMGAGILPDDSQTWHCAWHAPGNRDLSSNAVAICLNDPGPDAVTGAPVEPETIEAVFTEETLAANNTRIVEATCAPGDMLIAGGCHVEDAQLANAQLRLTRGNLLPPEDNRPNTWQCAWRNPTASTPRVVAAATCLKPASASRESQP